MDVTRKIPKVKIQELNDFKTDLIKRRLIVTQKNLIIKAIEFSLQNKDSFISLLENGRNPKI